MNHELNQPAQMLNEYLISYQNIVCFTVFIQICTLLFKSLVISKIFYVFKEVSYAHQGCICLITNTEIL